MPSRISCLVLVFLISHRCSVHGELTPKSSLTFAIDDTGSMGEEIEQVKASVNSIFDTVTMSNSSQIENFVLVTFNDPDAHLLTVTKDRNDFKTALRNIHIHGGGNCPEYAMKGIKIAVENSLPHSYVYVFTDASAEDYRQFEEIKTMAQKKQIQVTFLLTGKCGSRSDPDHQVYHKVATATSGQVFNMLKQDIKDILNYVVDSIKGRANILVAKTLPPGTHEIEFTVDAAIDNVTIAVAGESPTVDVQDPDGKNISTKSLVEKSEIKVVTFPKGKSGVYVTKVGSTSDKSVKVMGKTNIDFQHGFSAFEPTALSETSTTPPPDGDTYLSIQLVGDGVRLKRVKILDMDGEIIKDLELRLINKENKFYVTKQFLPPSATFKILVVGEDEETNTPVMRLAATPIERQSTKYETTVDTPPTVKVIDGPKINVNYGAPLHFKCKVRGYPKPAIKWYDNATGTMMPSNDFIIEAPYDYLSILSIEKSTKNATYVCKASNSVGNKDDYIQVNISTYFNILETPDYFTEFEYDKEANLSCVADALPPATVNWFRNDKPLFNDTNVVISNDSKTITIKHADINSRGKYMCQIENEFKSKQFNSYVVVTGLVKPKIDNIGDRYVVTKGEDAQLVCRVIEGKPTPMIQWFFRSEGGEEFKEIGKSEETLKMKKVTLEQVGIYLCTASNEMGTDRYAVEMIVDYPPTIKDSDHKLLAKDGDTVTIPCDVEGVPDPLVQWFKDGSLLPESSDYKMNFNHSLTFLAKVISDSGLYTCQAENPIGISKKSVSLDIYVPPHIEVPKETSINATVGNNELLTCHADGFPPPHVKWAYNGFRGTRPRKIRRGHRYEDMVLTLQNIQLQDEGYYTCIATNDYASTRMTYEVHVFAPPAIEKMEERTFSAVNGDFVVRIPCKATGGPKPTILWKKDGLNIAFGSDWFDMDEGTLIVKNIDEISQGTYTCIAENSVGNDTVEYNLKVTDYPVIEGTVSDLLVEKGQSVDIPCDIPYSSVALLRWYKNRKLLIEKKLTLKSVTEKDAGIYSCRVSDLDKSSSAHVRVVIGNKPSFITEEEENIEFQENDVVPLSCEARGEPTPEVLWRLNDETLNITDMLYPLEMQMDNRGKYTCIVSNAFGSIERSFNITTEDCIFDASRDFSSKKSPLMLSRSLKISAFHIYKGYMTLSNSDMFYLYCDSGFSMFPSNTIVEGFCEGGTTININKNILNFKEIECNEENKIATRTIKHKICDAGNTEYMQVGYNIHGKFRPLYEVCLDKDKNVPLFTKHKLSAAHYGFPSSVEKWFPHDLIPLDFDSMYNCRNQAAHLSNVFGRPFHKYDDCCFDKRQLVSPQDLKAGVPTSAAYSYLNVVPHWSTCNSKNWDAVEDKVRKFAKLFDSELSIWTGTADRNPRYSTFNTSDLKDVVIRDQRGRDQSVAQYLWKVVQDSASSSSLAIVQVNVPDLSPIDAPAYVHCADICSDIDWMSNSNWHNVDDGYTYCCSILDFESAFSYYGKFGRKVNVLYNERSVSHTYYSI